MSNENYLTWSDFIALEYIKVFGVAESKFEVGFLKFKMANPIWQDWNIKHVRKRIKLVTFRFLELLNPNLMLIFKIQNGETNMADRNYQTCSDLDETGDTMVFWVAESESGSNIEDQND